MIVRVLDNYGLHMHVHECMDKAYSYMLKMKGHVIFLHSLYQFMVPKFSASSVYLFTIKCSDISINVFGS